MPSPSFSEGRAAPLLGFDTHFFTTVTLHSPERLVLHLSMKGLQEGRGMTNFLKDTNDPLSPLTAIH